ncbi:NUDIX hydrolase [Georgenia sp. Z1491]|uniref:NUDIX hydrolase n=1 Tax=Georgenia sp. Z1491 TaxID=3416707 RepID=UPI003CFB80E8
MSRSGQKIVRAAGLVVWRVRDKKLEVLLVHSPRHREWGFPKGHLDPHETLQECAVREVAEETGETVVVGQPLGVVRYRLPGGGRKHVSYWAASADTPDGAWSRVRRVPPAALATEIDRVGWMEVREAGRELGHDEDREILGQLVDQWKDSRLDTWTVLLVRHARARSRSAWKGDEETRPLTAGGAVQAVGMGSLLSAYGVEHLVSSPWERCRATLTPYAERGGIEVELHDELTETAHAKRKRPVRALVDAALRRPTSPTAICTHRPVLPTVVATLLDRAPNRLRKTVPTRDPFLRTGEMLVVHCARRAKHGPAVVAVERVRAVEDD